MKIVIKLNDTVISRNLIGSLSLANGQCLPPRMDNFRHKTMATVNSHFVVVTEEKIFQMQDNAIPNNTKKATKLGMKVFRGKQCFIIQFATTCPLPSQPFLILITKLH